jgi:hypothetical protein
MFTIGYDIVFAMGTNYFLDRVWQRESLVSVFIYYLGTAMYCRRLWMLFHEGSDNVGVIW